MERAPPKTAGRGMLMAIVLLVVGLLIGALIGIFVGPALRPAAPAAAPLKVIGPWSGAEQAAFLPILDLFARTTGVEYEFVTERQEDLQTTLPTQFAARQTPGDLIFMPSAFVKQYGLAGHALNLAGTIPEGNYAPGALDPVKDGSNLWGGAYTGKVKPGFWYRRSFFQANGFTEPTTFAEFQTLLGNIEAAIPGANNAIISGDGVGWPLSDVTEHFIATYGGPAMHRALTGGTLAWTDPTVRAVFNNFLVPTLSGGFWSAPVQWDTGVASWFNGDYGLYFMGSWITGMVSNPADLDVFALPGAPGTSGIVFAADYFFVPAYTGQAANARQLAAFLSGKDAQTAQVRQGGHLATNRDVALTSYPVVDAAVAALLAGKDVLSDLDDTKGGTFQTTFWSQLQGLWANPTTLDTVLVNIEAAA